MTGDERLAKVASAIHHAAERCVHPEYADAPCERWADALAPLLDEFRAEDEARALREFTLWVAINRAFNGSDYKHGQSLYNECLNAALPEWAADYAAEPDAGERPVDLTRLNYGICPKCGEDKFIGHGPWCIDCFTGGGA